MRMRWPQVPAASHQGAQEARQHTWGLYCSSLLLALASQFTFPATGRHPAHTSQASGRDTEMPSTSQCAELPCTPLEWLTCATGLTTRLHLMVGVWQL